MASSVSAAALHADIATFVHRCDQTGVVLKDPKAPVVQQGTVLGLYVDLVTHRFRVSREWCMSACVFLERLLLLPSMPLQTFACLSGCIVYYLYMGYHSLGLHAWHLLAHSSRQARLLQAGALAWHSPTVLPLQVRHEIIAVKGLMSASSWHRPPPAFPSAGQYMTCFVDGSVVGSGFVFIASPIAHGDCIMGRHVALPWTAALPPGADQIHREALSCLRMLQYVLAHRVSAVLAVVTDCRPFLQSIRRDFYSPSPMLNPILQDIAALVRRERFLVSWHWCPGDKLNPADFPSRSSSMFDVVSPVASIPVVVPPLIGGL